MLTYVLQRLLIMIPTFLGATLIVFSMTRFVPGGPVDKIIMESSAMAVEGHGSQGASRANQGLSDDQIEQLKAFYGLDKPVHVAYVEWLSNLVKFDLGESTRYFEPVWEMIKERLPISIFFGFATFLISYLISIPLGVIKAIKHNSLTDNASSVLIFIGFAVPAYIVGIFLLTAFSFHLEWFPMGGFRDEDWEDFIFWEGMVDIVWHCTLPLICYVIGEFAVLTLTMKNSMMENLSADYVRTAVAKGLPFNVAVLRHAFRNSLIPIAAHFGNLLTAFLAGSFLIEVVFNINGIGLLGYESLVERDYPVVMGILAVTTLLFLIGNLLSDILVALVDPRVKYGS